MKKRCRALAAMTSFASSFPSPFWSCAGVRPEDRRAWCYGVVTTAGAGAVRGRPCVLSCAEDRGGGVQSGSTAHQELGLLLGKGPNGRPVDGDEVVDLQPLRSGAERRCEEVRAGWQSHTGTMGPN